MFANVIALVVSGFPVKGKIVSGRTFQNLYIVALNTIKPNLTSTKLNHPTISPLC
jgi:hypothetical protein